MLSNEELANIFIQTMQAHANPRSYDWAMYSVGIGGFIASVIVAYFAYQLNEQQTNMLEQQNKIALFRERFVVYNFYKQLDKNITDKVYNLEFQRFGNTINKQKLIYSFFSQINEISYPPTSSGLSDDQIIRNFSEIDELLDMIKYLFELDCLSEARLCTFQEELKKFKDTIISTGVTLDYIKLICEMVAENHLKDTMKEQLYVTKITKK